MGHSRTENVKRNIFYGYISTIVGSLFSFAVRTVFVRTLGEGYLGIAGLFSNILGLLSFSELGIGVAINFALYKPIAEEDTEKVKSLLRLYKVAYRAIAGTIAAIGIGLLPFLPYLVKSDIPMSMVRVYYLIFLFNTVSSYLVAYKMSYVNALQKNYVITNIATVGTVATNVLQMGLLLLGGNYLGYLLVAAGIELLQKVVTVCYLHWKFPILTDKDAQPLDEATRKDIWKNVKAMVIHKIGDVSVHQTDNIIISSFVSTAAVGLLSNYTTISSVIGNFTSRFFGSFAPSIGNMLAKEPLEKQRHIFDVYDLLGFWIHGFVLISFVTLSQPFITLWLGKNLLVDNATMTLYFVSIYLEGMSVIPFRFKAAAGKFNEDKWVAFVQALTNLIVSIWAINRMGLPGVFVGTIVSRMIVIVTRPYIVFKYVLKGGLFHYLLRLTARTALALALCLLMWKIQEIVLPEVTVLGFGFLCLLTAVIPNAVFFALFHRSEAFHDILSRLHR